MPTYVFHCEGCGGRRPFLVQEEPGAQDKKAIERHCPTCRTTTTWVVAFAERRGGEDRRKQPDRRSSSDEH